MWLNHILLYEDNAAKLFKLGPQSAKTEFVKGHAQILFDSLRNTRNFQFFQAIVWVILISLHILFKKDEEFNFYCVSLLFLWTIVTITFSMFTRLEMKVISSFCFKPADRSRYINIKQRITYLVSWFLDFWHAADWFLQYCMFIYVVRYSFELGEDYMGQLLAFSSFCAWLKLISFFRFFREPGKLVFTILYIAQKSLIFILILIIVIIAISFSRLAHFDDTNFYTQFQWNYGLAFGDFKYEYDDHDEFLAFIVSTYTVPLLFLNLLISIM